VNKDEFVKQVERIYNKAMEISDLQMAMTALLSIRELGGTVDVEDSRTCAICGNWLVCPTTLVRAKARGICVETRNHQECFDDGITGQMGIAPICPESSKCEFWISKGEQE